MIRGQQPLSVLSSVRKVFTRAWLSVRWEHKTNPSMWAQQIDYSTPFESILNATHYTVSMLTNAKNVSLMGELSERIA